MNVDSYINHDLNIPEYKRFSFMATDTINPLAEKELFSIIKDEMQKKGYSYDNNNPQFQIVARRGVKTEERQEDVRSRPAQVYQPPPIGSKDNRYGTWQTQYVTEGGGTYTVNIKWIRIEFIDLISSQKDGKTNYLWQGEVHSQGKRTLNETTKCLTNGLLLDYPTKLNRTKRILNYDECN
ncbi:MAG: hypothetical protein CSYNP_01278 [Syntrophus sp. SKADARSKE-3]|nr:hypothetical protein [Syntrophus sp. SKADARSKE-3]